MAAWCEAVGRALRSEMKVPEVCNFENHKCDNGDEHEGRQCNHFMPCLKHPIASLEMFPSLTEQKRHPHLGGFPKWRYFFCSRPPSCALHHASVTRAQRDARTIAKRQSGKLSRVGVADSVKDP
jgi:hypothetical protein